MRKIILLLALVAMVNTIKVKAAHNFAIAALQPDTSIKQLPAEPFAFGDFTWLNGNNRQKNTLLDSKYFTGSITIDVNYTQSNHTPIDNTVVGSTALARNNEVQVAYVGLGGDFHWNNVRGRFMTQLGTRSTLVPRNDFSQYKGQYDLANAYRYISEAYAGYHWDVWHGINLDAGIFMSYVGLMSYNNFENWGYQPSFTSDNTPWFFNGLRLQTFPTDKLKIELWLINGWQSYARYNKMPGFGFQIKYAPKEYLNFVSNGYFGKDAAGIPTRVRWHSDNSFLIRYFNQPKKTKGITKAAFSLTGDIGFENGGGVTPFSSKDGKDPAQILLVVWCIIEFGLEKNMHGLLVVVLCITLAVIWYCYPQEMQVHYLILITQHKQQVHILFLPTQAINLIHGIVQQLLILCQMKI
jgi:hypothetical protein